MEGCSWGAQCPDSILGSDLWSSNFVKGSKQSEQGRELSITSKPSWLEVPTEGWESF